MVQSTQFGVPTGREALEFQDGSAGRPLWSFNTGRGAPWSFNTGVQGARLGVNTGVWGARFGVSTRGAGRFGVSTRGRGFRGNGFSEFPLLVFTRGSLAARLVLFQNGRPQKYKLYGNSFNFIVTV